MYLGFDQNEKDYSNTEINDLFANNEIFTLNLTVNPSSLVVNCTEIEFRCIIVSNETDFSSKNVPIWWTFQGVNVSASTLPNGRITNENNASILGVTCAQFGIHAGVYQCHSYGSDTGNSLKTSSNNVTLNIHSKFTKHRNLSSLVILVDFSSTFL